MVECRPANASGPSRAKAVNDVLTRGDVGDDQLEALKCAQASITTAFRFFGVAAKVKEDGDYYYHGGCPAE